MKKLMRSLVVFPLTAAWLLEGKVTGRYPPRRMEPVLS